MCSPASPRISTRFVREVADWCNRQTWPVVVLALGSRAISSRVRTKVGTAVLAGADDSAACKAGGTASVSTLACFKKQRRWIVFFIVIPTLQGPAQMVEGGRSADGKKRTGR